METDPLGQSPRWEGSWEHGNEVGCFPLQVDLGTGVTLNAGICESAALHKLDKKVHFEVALFLSESHCYHSEQLVLCKIQVSLGVQGLNSFVYAQMK